MSFLGAQNSIALGVQGLIHIDTGGGAGGSADYLLAKSLRFRSSASAYLNRTASASISTFTVSMWVKRGVLSSSNYQYLFSYFNSGNTDGYGLAYFASTDTLYVYAGGTLQQTTAVYRDPAAWYHIVLSNNAGSFTLYVNGVSVKTGTAATIPSNSSMNIGRYGYDGGLSYFDGEMAEINFVDGQALAPTAFGAFSTYNQWLPKKYAGTYGTNGFYLPFTNTTSTSTLVADSSGNANNWTPNNISLTAGSTYDSLTDVPTLTSTTVANYAVLNPLMLASTTLSNGNLTATKTATVNVFVTGTIAISSGKWYWECLVVTQAALGNIEIGVIKATATSATWALSSGVWWGDQSPNNAYRYGTNLGSIGISIAAGNVLGIALDMNAGTIALYQNNTLINTISGVDTTTPHFPMWNSYASGDAGSLNFGQQPFTYTPPTGFLPLTTYNIAAGTVTTSGTFTGNLSTDGPFVFLNGTPTAMTINGNAVTFGTHADKLANGFKVRSSSVLYNLIGSNTYVATTVGAVFKYEDAQSNP